MNHFLLKNYCQTVIIGKIRPLNPYGFMHPFPSLFFHFYHSAQDIIHLVGVKAKELKMRMLIQQTAFHQKEACLEIGIFIFNLYLHSIVWILLIEAM